MNQILYNTSKTTDKSKLLIILLVVLICVIICLSTVFALANSGNDKILKNVYISGVDVSKLTKDDAEKILIEKVDEYRERELVLSLNGDNYDVSAESLGFDCENIDEAVEEAYNYGRSGNLLQNNFTILFSNFKNKELELTYGVQEEEFEDVIDDIASKNETIAFDDAYQVSGDAIIITKGKDGSKIDSETLLSYLVTSILNNVETIEVPVIDAESKRVDLDDLYAETYVAPQNATFVSGEKFEIIEEKPGKDFDVEKARADYDALGASGEMVISLRDVEATVKVVDLDSQLYKDVLATYSTTYNVNETNRVKNLKTSSERCNSTVVYPGEEFSFHKTIGTRTIANGYAPGNSFAGGRVVTSVGGGICQVSSMLYNVVLLADLDVTERTNHGMYVTYVKPSLDATISEGVFDFKFKNNRSCPIKITAEMNNGVLTMSILGIKEPDDQIIELESVVLETIEPITIYENDSTMLQGTTKVVQQPVNGYVSEAYKVVKDENGNIISRTLISKDKYAVTNEIVKKGTKVEAPPVVEQPPVVEEPPVTPPVEEEPDRDLPPGWDSPESPYA